jgi:hypothetical protein
MKITLGTVETGTVTTGKNAGQPYMKAKGSIAHFPKAGDKTRTVMAFGAGLEKVADMIATGATVDVKWFFDDGSIVIAGPADVEAPAEAIAA